MIPIFVGSSERFASVEWMTPYSIEENTAFDVRVHVVRPARHGMKESGCTGFTHVRWAVPQLCREMGYEFGIYLDVDMLVLSDIAELWGYRKSGSWVCLRDGTDEVSVICSTLKYPDKSVLHNRHPGTLPRGFHCPEIPLSWNCEDSIQDGMKLLHFTDLKCQPWFTEHPCKEAVGIYRNYESRYRRDRAEPHARGNRKNTQHAPAGLRMQ